MSNLKCPVCGSSNIQTERRPDGFHHCMDCRYSWEIGGVEMSKINCPNCRYFNETEQLCYKWKSRMYADHSCEYFEAVQMANATVFQQLTASPEMLAPNFVYCNVTVKTIPSTSREQPGGVELTKGWYSTIIPDKVWSNEEEAIAATVAKLKEVAK